MSHAADAGNARSSSITARLVQASNGDPIHAVPRMLECIAQTRSSFACVVWECAENANPQAIPPTGDLFVLAEWLDAESEFFAKHDLPIDGTATGRVVHTGHPLRIDDIQKEGGVTNKDPFVLRHDLGPMVSVPIRFVEGSQGALNLYRRRSDSPFNEQDLDYLLECAEVVPSLLSAIQNHAGFDLLARVDETIRKAEVASTPHILSKARKREYLHEICRHTAEAFRCLEVSVFLEIPTDEPGWYELQATTWPIAIEKNGYHADAREGVTAWVAANRRSVKIFDLRRITPEAKLGDDGYNGPYWSQSDKFLEQLRRHFGNVEGRELPPVSHMAAPIMMGDRVLGIIRCCTARMSPYYYADRELRLLELVAAQVAQCWSSWLDRRAMLQEKEAAVAMVKSVTQLNTFVQSAFAKPNPQMSDILDRMLGEFARRVTMADAVDIRLHDRAKDELRFAVTYGKPWKFGTPKEQKDRLSVAFPIGDQAKPSIGAHVFRTRKPYHCPDTQHDPFFRNSGIFPNAKRLFCAPIIVGGDVFGVFDVLGFGPRPFPENVNAFAELFGRQLGLYLSLGRLLDQLRDAEVNALRIADEVRKRQSEQQQVFEDLSHQLKGPVRLARRRAEMALDRVGLMDDSRSDLQALRGLLRKTDRVTRSLRILSEIGQQKTVSIEKSPLDESRLIPLLIEAAHDTELFVGSSRGIRFDVDRDSFRLPALRRVLVDFDLLEQAINNLCDNAAKYSFDHTIVRIFGGLTARGRYHISIANQGLKIRPNDIRRCIMRGWRSDEAIWTTGEGSGIGLWIVDGIMTAHGGQLIIDPTDATDVTTVKLVFPLTA